VRTAIEETCRKRKIGLKIDDLQEQPVTACAPWLMAQMDAALGAEGLQARRLPSGAGHDGMAMHAIADIAMLFVRCKGGVSHNPAESISAEDAGAGARVLLRFISHFEKKS
jgi:allantoate deiminase